HGDNRRQNQRPDRPTGRLNDGKHWIPLPIKQQTKCSARVRVSASTNCSNGAFDGFCKFSTIDVDKSVKNCLPPPLNTRPQRKKRFGTKSSQYAYTFIINEL
ncbi:MAG: hypothetical protein K0M48_10615, partial [Thiobacillus sp.]|nr:hypothetical protein [Thiobacillus sp.]